MIALLAALALAAPPADAAAPPPPKPPASIDKAVDANGVPAWAKRKHFAPVQNCATRPNIGVETWRDLYDKSGKGRIKPRPTMNTCR